MSQTLIIDAQVFQSEAWDRGMGKYSLHFLEALLGDSKFPFTKTMVLFSKNLKLQPEAEETLRKKLGKAEFAWLDLKVPKLTPREKLDSIIQANTKLLDEFVATKVEGKSSFIVLAPFIDTICSVYPSQAEKTVLVYDLIPLLYFERYSKSHMYQNYLKRFQLLIGADRILTISQTVADDVAVYTGINPDKITNIDGAPIHRDGLAAKKPDIDLPNKFFLMPSGDELRKNNFRAAEAFEEYRKITGNMDERLVLTSHFQPKTIKALNIISNGLVFTGNVSEAELLWLYQNAVATVFVSEYEGLGLPVLEAVEVGKPVVCSNLTVFDEMSESAFYYADEQSVASIALAINHVATDQDFATKQKEYPKILARYTWQETAKKALAALTKPLPPKLSKKPRLAIFAPDPAGYSAIGKVVQLLHPALTDYFDVDYYIETAREGNTFKRASYLSEVANVYPASSFNAKNYADYDSVLYHIGNSEYHLDSIKNALHLPGHIITHDLKLKNIFDDLLIRLTYMEPSRVKAEHQLDEALRAEKTACLTSLVDASLGVINHSHYATDATEQINPNHTPVNALHLPAAVPTTTKVKLDEDFKLGFAGIINPAKGISLVEEIVNSTNLQNIDIHIFGIPLMSATELGHLEALPNVTLESNLSDFDFENRLRAMDAIVTYRPNYNGETSLTVIEALRYGVIPIVRNIGWFSELPDDCVEKVDSEAEVMAAVARLSAYSKNELAAKKLAAKNYIAQTSTYQLYAKELHQVITGNDQGHKAKLAAALRSGPKKADLIKLAGN